MRFIRTAIIAGAASAALAGAALAARDDAKVMLIALPDGSVQHVQYQADAPPQLVLVHAPAPVDFLDAAFGPHSLFAEMDHMSAMMAARADAMMRQAAAMQARTPAAQAPATGNGIVMTNAQGTPVGVMQYSYVSSTTSADGCTRTISYSSDGAASAQQPRVIRTSSGSCASQGQEDVIRSPDPVTRSRSAPAAKPAPKITPVSRPEPLKSFTPSRT